MSSVFPYPVGYFVEPADLNSVGLWRIWDSVDAGVTFPAASIVTPPISQAFRNLRVTMSARSDRAAANSDPLNLRFNGDTGSDYVYETITADGSSLGAARTGPGGVIGLGSIPAASAITYQFGSLEILVSDYASAIMHTGISKAATLNDSGQIMSTTTAFYWVPPGTPPAVVDELDFFLTYGNFVAGTKITLYGEA